MKKRRRNALQELYLLNEKFKGEVTNDKGVPVLVVDPSIGSGQINVVNLEKGLTAMEFDLSLKKDFELLMDKKNDETVYLFYCLKGNCFHKFSGHEIVTKLEELQTAVVFNDNEHTTKLIFNREEHVVFNCLRVDIKEYQKDIEASDSETLVSLLKSYDKEIMGHLHVGKFNLEIGELIKKLDEAKYANSIASLSYFNGVCHMILAKQIEQFKKDLEKGLKPATTLLKKELEMISEVTDYINNYPEAEHSINNISEKSGLSPSKLQLGFKFMHDATLGEYIRLVRLRKAEELIRTTDLNISQVVYSIGFTSRSYFCKIFKKKYNCSPKTYKKNANRIQLEKEKKAA
ncbi:AraC family transcriptional regulator [Maribacter sp. PR1]|uniref:AraC family transcriptional regulator n=1 Tax=Maribacter cobaltidurans TaxID=1178778 RepID=A0ABU7IUF2_9FLAO|nr:MULTISPECIES: AraC family transcriptional regulator [Maribacter]MDC6389034.1 AraC family transcriptional regulator [Maribacter sp. PR1]MEE1976421.1 AraC family transcriptional regulator [Maribacter cobaltidurans]